MVFKEIKEGRKLADRLEGSWTFGDPDSEIIFWEGGAAWRGSPSGAACPTTAWGAPTSWAPILFSCPDSCAFFCGFVFPFLITLEVKITHPGLSWGVSTFSFVVNCWVPLKIDLLKIDLYGRVSEWTSFSGQFTSIISLVMTVKHWGLNSPQYKNKDPEGVGVSTGTLSSGFVLACLVPMFRGSKWTLTSSLSSYLFVYVYIEGRQGYIVHVRIDNMWEESCPHSRGSKWTQFSWSSWREWMNSFTWFLTPKSWNLKLVFVTVSLPFGWIYQKVL